MIKPTFLRRVAIAALLTGSCFSTVAAPPVSYGVEEDVFHPVRAKQGMVASVDATATQVGWISSRRAGMPLMLPWRWATRWQ